MKAVVVNEFGGGFHTEEVSIADPKEISLDEVTEGYESPKDSSVTRVVITQF